MADFDGNDDFFDSRDMQERIDELEGIAVIDRDEDEQEELDKLYAFKEEVADDLEFDSGITFISEDYFEDYAEEMLKDIGALPAELPGYISNNIDWEGVADELKVDYTTIELGGVTYYYR
jgi:hypothetical protein